MRRLVSITVFFTVFAFVPLTAQNDSGHVFVANFWKATPGNNAQYNRFVREFSYPYYDELIKQGWAVSYRFVVAWSGNGEYTHLFITEYENWDAVDDGGVDGAAACQSAFGMTCAERRAEIGIEDVTPLRVHVRREVWGSLRP